MKHIYSYQEIGPLIDQGKPAAFTRQLAARFCAVRKDPASDGIGVTIELSLGGDVIMIEMSYPRIETVLDTFNISNLAEIWEVVE